MKKKKTETFTVEIVNLKTKRTQTVRGLTLKGLFRLIKATEEELIMIFKEN